ncbi:MAG TPA: UPF0182 family protein [Eubacteriaceae bacterium]|nr:UPF0182 family protein [Eubacteriaceae bacterium]
MNKSNKVLTIIILILGIIGGAFALSSRFYIDYLWFAEMGYTQVFLKEIVTKTQIFIPMFIALTIIVYFYFEFLKKVALQGKVITIIKKKVDIIPLGASTVLSFVITFLATNALWYKLLEFINAEPFNVKDPIFGKDISFYVFKLPFLDSLHAVLSSILFLVFISTIIFTAGYYLSKSAVQVEVGEEKRPDLKKFFIQLGKIMTKQIGVFIGLFFLLAAFGYYLQSLELLYSPSGISFGAGYTDSVIRLRLYQVLMYMSIGASVISIVAGFRRKLKLFFIAPTLIIVVSFLGGVVGLIVENYVVVPNQFGKEEQYLKRHIEYTRKAYGIENVRVQEFSAQQDITIEDIEENDLTIKNIPINDYRPTLDMYNSIQGFRIYYEFNDVDIDRYIIDGEYTQVFISAREMNNDKLEENAKTWINQHLKYTHGFGIAVSPVNKVNEVGQPDLTVKDIPPRSTSPEIQVDEPRIYFGESTNTYAITNAKTAEFDYPEGSDNQENFYEGTAGISLNLLNRLAFAIQESDLKILLSSEITSESKILIKRNIAERISEIAPFLSYDEDPYIVASEGKLYWIMDAFTVSNRYPYAQPFDQGNTFNYIRNSIKVVVDAYNGEVVFYQVEEDDPIANVYKKIYPDIFKPIDEMPQDLRSHVRYSQDMFDVQADIYRTYHMQNTRVFYNKEDQWELPRQIYGSEKEVENIESTYLIMKLPEREAEFTLMIPYTARQKDNMVAWMAAMNDGDSYGDIMVYTFPKQSLVYGPMQIEQRIDQDTIISPQLTLLGQQGSQVIRGNMMAIPVEEAILYVEPVYIKARDSERSLPEVKKIVVSYKNRIIMADSLQEGLTQIFGEYEDDDENENPVEQDLSSLIIQANSLFEGAQRAQREGNWAEYGELISQLEEVLNQLNAIQESNSQSQE